MYHFNWDEVLVIHLDLGVFHLFYTLIIANIISFLEKKICAPENDMQSYMYVHI